MKKLIIQFDAERKRLGTLHPGDIFYYKKSLWMSINRTEKGRLIRKMGPGSQVSEIRPARTMVSYLYNGKKTK